MTISTTRSRIRTIGSTTLAAAVGLGMGALAVTSAPSASAASTPVSQPITYDCAVHITQSALGNDYWFPGPDRSGTVPITVDTTSSIPTSVTQGEAIPATPVTLTLHMPNNLRDVTPTMLGAYACGGSSDANVKFITNVGTAQATLAGPGGTGPIADNWRKVVQDANSDGVTDEWLIPVTGQVPSVTVPPTATGSITVEAPATFTIKAEHNDDQSETIKSTSEVLCAQAPGSVLKLGEIPISGTAPLADTKLSGSAAPSAVGTPATVNLSVEPASATGTVKLTYLGAEVGTATLASGTAAITVPAATLPKAGTFVLNAEYSGDLAHKTVKADVTVVRTAAPAPLPGPAVQQTSTVAGKPKPKTFKVNKPAKLKVAVKSASTSLAGKVTVKVGSKTLGKGTTDATGKVTVKLKKIKKSFVKKGKIKLKVTYAGNDTTKASKTTVKVKVKG